MEKIYLVLDIVFMIGLLYTMVSIVRTNKATRECERIRTKAVEEAVKNKSLKIENLHISHPGCVDIPRGSEVHIETENYYNYGQKSENIFGRRDW